MPRSIDEDLLLDLIDRIYAAGHGEIDWSEVTDPIRGALDCSVVTIHADDPLGDGAVVVAHSGLSSEQMGLYEEYYYSTNLWLDRAAPILKSGVLLHGEEVVEQGKMRQTEYYADYLQPNRMEWALSACLHREPRLVALMSLFRPPGSERFSATEVDVVDVLLPHLQRAVSAARRLRGLQIEVGLAEKALGALGCGALVLDDSGRVVVHNGRMMRIVEEDDGLFLHRDRLRFHSSSAQGSFEEILHSPPLTRGGGGFKAPRPSYRRAYEVVVIRIPRRERAASIFAPLRDSAGWLVLVSDPEMPLAAAEPLLEQVFDLTESEARITVRLAAGQTVPEIARARDRSINTVKSQVRWIYRKLQVSNRAELVHRVGIFMKTPPFLADDGSAS